MVHWWILPVRRIAGQTGPACVNRVIARLARKAYRRPVTGAEVAGLTRFVKMATDDGQSVEQGIGLAIQAMLVSPHFLFRLERDPDPRVGDRIAALMPGEVGELRCSEMAQDHRPATLLTVLGRVGDPR